MLITVGGLIVREGRQRIPQSLTIKGIMKFAKKGKLSPRYIDQFEILELGAVAY